jgi:GNAT superfamily N-acetyltransferase
LATKDLAKSLARSLAKSLARSSVRAVKRAHLDKARRRPGGKSRSKASVRKGAQRPVSGRRPVLTSVRRPKAERTRGPARSRVTPRPRAPKRKLPAQTGAASQYEIRDFAAQDAAAVNAVALAAFAQYRGAYSDWPQFAKRVGAMASLAHGGELIVGVSEGRIVGAVGYFGPAAAKPVQFDPDWSIIRLLVVDPAERGHGLGRLLTEECIRRARRDGAAVIALHTSPIMQVALAMYLRLGFVLLREMPPIFDVPYCIYLKRL